jgi:hypothetical protein
MLIFGIVLLIIGAVVAAFIHHTIGIIIAVVGGILVLVALLFLADANTADAAILGFGPHAARLLRWAADRLGPMALEIPDRPLVEDVPPFKWDGSTLDTTANMWATTTGTKPTYTVSPHYAYSWPKPGDPARN